MSGCQAGFAIREQMMRPTLCQDLRFQLSGDFAHAPVGFAAKQVP